jgi:hypothetical protein
MSLGPGHRRTDALGGADELAVESLMQSRHSAGLLGHLRRPGPRGRPDAGVRWHPGGGKTACLPAYVSPAVSAEELHGCLFIGIAL